MAFNGGDIVVGIKLALKLYEYGFEQENAADVLYKNFQNDIFNFHHMLEKLDDALYRAQQRYMGSARTTRIDAHEPLSAEFEQERKTIIGNYVKTLETCEQLLEENKKFRVRYSNVLENLRWHLGQQVRRVDDLRTRLHFHSEKISLVVDRLSLNLLTDLDAKVDDLHALVEENLDVSKEVLLEINRLRSTVLSHLSGQKEAIPPNSELSHPVSDSIAQRFEHYLSVDAPPNIGSGIPIVQGFDAVFQYFEQSTSSSEQTPGTYLLFLKTRWLLDRLTASQAFRSARPGYYYKRAVNQISQAVKVVMRQSGLLIAYDESVLMALPDTDFRIWPPVNPEPSKTKASEPHPLMIRANEVKLMSMSLASDEDSGADATIFKNSDEQFRIVSQTTLPSRPGERILVPLTVRVAEDKLVPRYAIPTIEHPEPELAVVSRNEETLYRFRSLQNLYQFQTALTGYDVSHDQEDIACQFSKDAKALDCTARVQLWQDSIIFGSAVGPDGRQRSAPGASSSLTDGSHSRYDSLAASVVTSNTIRFVDGVWEAENVKLPAITIFTELADAKKRKSLAILFIELDVNIHIDPNKCSCCRDYDTCSKLILVHQRKKLLNVRVLFSDVDSSGQSSFDLLPFRIPRHPSFHELKTWRTEYLLLKFATLQAKKDFDKELRFRFSVRDAQVKKQENFRNELHRLEDQRQRQRNPSLSPMPIRVHERSMSESSTISSQPPKLEIPEAGSGLGIGLSRGGSVVYEIGAGDAVVASPMDMRSSGPSLPVTSRRLSELNGSSAPRRDSGVQAVAAAERQYRNPARADSQQRRSEPPRYKTRVASVETIHASLQSDIPTTRDKSEKKKGFWKSFKP